MYRQLVKNAVSHSKKIQLNAAAPEGQRWCNFLCQAYVPVDQFYDSPSRVSGLCRKCEGKNNMCRRYIKQGRMTAEEFRNDPTILDRLKCRHQRQDVEGADITCVECNTLKPSTAFELNRQVCKECRLKKAQERISQEFQQHLERIEQLKNTPELLHTYLKSVPVHTLHKIMSHYEVGRDQRDKKADVVVKLTNHFRRIQDPHLCLGNCGFSLPEKFSYCNVCKKAPKKTTDEKNLEFREHLPEFMKTLTHIPDQDQFEYNGVCLHAIAEYLGLKLSKNKGHTKLDYIHQINEELAERAKDERNIIPAQPEPLELDGVVVFARDDGYVNATQLCKAGGKLFGDWHRTESTKTLIEALSSDMGIPISQLVESKKGNTTAFKQGTWIHPDLAVQLAQWVSPSFALKVSRYIRELMLTGAVAVKEAKTEVQLVEIQKELKSTKAQHERMLQKRHYHKFKKGPCFYILSDVDSASKKFKVGFDGEDINARLQMHRTSLPGAQLELLVYAEKSRLVETNMLQRYESLRKYNNHEWIYDIDIDHLRDSVNTILNFLGIKHTFEENVASYNAQVALEQE